MERRDRHSDEQREAYSTYRCRSSRRLQEEMLHAVYDPRSQHFDTCPRFALYTVTDEALLSDTGEPYIAFGSLGADGEMDADVTALVLDAMDAAGLDTPFNVGRFCLNQIVVRLPWMQRVAPTAR